MGGIGSGRSGGRPIVETSLTLEVRRLRLNGLLLPGERTGAWSWSWTTTRQPLAEVTYSLDIGEDSGSVRIDRVTRYGPLGNPVITDGQVITLTTTPGRFGGRRWWFVCPLTGAHVAKLYLPHGTTCFAARKAYRLGYACQR